MAAKKKEEGKETKERIFEAAQNLIARKGFAAVTVREIAKKADANISMINYYYGGKLGMLRALLNDFYNKYYNAVLSVKIEVLSKEEVVEAVIHNLVKFYDDNTELAVATHNAFAIDMPEIADLEMKWVKSRREQMNAHFKKLGLDTGDKVTMTVMRGLLTAIIAYHFQSKYAWEYTKEAREKEAEEIEEFVGEETTFVMDEEFYKRYSKILAHFYLTGLYGITGEKREPAEEKTEDDTEP